MEGLSQVLFLLAVLLLLPRSTQGLMCYACEDQESNKDKCIRTVVQCEAHHDACMTKIVWGLPPRWFPHGFRANYLSKDCDTMKSCLEKKSSTMSQCKRDWFRDWTCYECCAGDMCNYYVTMSATRSFPAITISMTLLTAAIVILMRL